MRAVLLLAALAALPAAAQQATQLALSGVPGILYTAGSPGTVTVTVETSGGATVGTSAAAITLQISGPNGYQQSLAGAAAAGVAQFDTSSWKLADGNYTLTAASPGLASATGAITVLASAVTLPATAVGRISAPQNITFGFAAATMVTAVQVLYEGASNLDFFNVGSSSCTGAQKAGATCTVAVAFQPRARGLRLGAVELTGTAGAVLQTIYISGTGLGPALNFPPSKQAQVGQGLGYPDALAFDAHGNLYIADYPADASAGRVVKIPVVNGALNSAAQAAFSANLNYVDGLAFDGAGNLYVADYDENKIIEVPAGAPANGSGNITLLSSPNPPYAQLWNPAGLAVDGGGDLFICDYSNNRLIELPNQNGHLNPNAPIYLGNGLVGPSDVKVDPAGDLIIADWGNARIVEIPYQNGALNPAAQTTIYTEPAGEPAALALDAAGDLYITWEVEDTAEVVPYQNGTYNAAAAYTVARNLNTPDAIQLDGAGNIYYCDTYNGFCYEADTVDAPGLSFATTPVGQTSAPQSVEMLSTGNQALSINGIQYDPVFPNEGTSCTGNLAPGMPCSLTVGFAPKALGAVTTSAKITDNAGNQASITQPVGLSGTGTQGTQAITLAPEGPLQMGDTVTLSATGGGSGNPVTFSLVSGPGSLNGAQLTATGAGTIVIAANQAGSTLYLAAPQVTESIQVLKATPATSWTPGAPTSFAYGQTLAGLLDASSSVAGTWSYSVNGQAVTNATVLAQGSYTIQATFTPQDTADYDPVTLNLAITVTAALPATPHQKTTSLRHDVGGRPLGAGTTLWFDATFRARGATDGTVLAFLNGQIQFQLNGAVVTLPVPNAVVTFSAKATQATTVFDASTGVWRTTLPLETADRDHDGDNDAMSVQAFLDGVAYPLPGALKGELKDVTWSGTLASNNANLAVGWEWNASAYSAWNSNPNALGIEAWAHGRSWSQGRGAGMPLNLLGSRIALANGRDEGAGERGGYAIVAFGQDFGPQAHDRRGDRH